MIQLKPRNEGRFAHTIYQEDIIELKLLSREFDDARRAYLDKRKYIRAALESGATVEPGLHSAEIIVCEREGFTVLAGTFKKLIIK